MIERYYLGAYWGNRKETAAECAERAVALLQWLSRCDEAFGRWFQGGRSRKEALQREVRPDPAVLRPLLERGRNRRDDDRSVIEELGFRMGLWNGAADSDAV